MNIPQYIDHGTHAEIDIEFYYIQEPRYPVHHKLYVRSYGHLRSLVVVWESYDTKYYVEIRVVDNVEVAAWHGQQYEISEEEYNSIKNFIDKYPFSLPEPVKIIPISLPSQKHDIINAIMELEI